MAFKIHPKLNLAEGAITWWQSNYLASESTG